MVSFAIGLAAGIVVLALACWCTATGFRNGDCPGDATVSAVLRDAGQPDEPRPVIVATVANPAGVPVVVALSARPRRLPARIAWLAPLTITAPRWTARRKFGPTGFGTVGVVPAWGSVRCTVPVPAAGPGYLPTAAIGEPAGRLRLHRLRVAGDRVTARATLPV